MCRCVGDPGSPLTTAVARMDLRWSHYSAPSGAVCSEWVCKALGTVYLVYVSPGMHVGNAGCQGRVLRSRRVHDMLDVMQTRWCMLQEVSADHCEGGAGP